MQSEISTTPLQAYSTQHLNARNAFLFCFCAVCVMLLSLAWNHYIPSWSCLLTCSEESFKCYLSNDQKKIKIKKKVVVVGI